MTKYYHKFNYADFERKKESLLKELRLDEYNCLILDIVAKTGETKYIDEMRCSRKIKEALKESPPDKLSETYNAQLLREIEEREDLPRGYTNPLHIVMDSYRSNFEDFINGEIDRPDRQIKVFFESFSYGGFFNEFDIGVNFFRVLEDLAEKRYKEYILSESLKQKLLEINELLFEKLTFICYLTAVSLNEKKYYYLKRFIPLSLGDIIAIRHELKEDYEREKSIEEICRRRYPRLKRNNSRNSENEFEDEIENILKESGLTYERNIEIGPHELEVDFIISDNKNKIAIIECKTGAKAKSFNEMRKFYTQHQLLKSKKSIFLGKWSDEISIQDEKRMKNFAELMGICYILLRGEKEKNKIIEILINYLKGGD